MLRTLEWRIDNHYVAGLLDVAGELAPSDMIPDAIPRNSFYRVLGNWCCIPALTSRRGHVACCGRTGRGRSRLEPIHDGASTRLLTWSCVTGSPAIRPVWHLLPVPGDCVLARRMLRGIKRLSERTSGATQMNSGSTPSVERGRGARPVMLAGTYGTGPWAVVP